MGNSKSTARSEQEGKAYITQQFAGTCEIICDNQIGNLTIDIVNTYVAGDIAVTQTCSTNGACVIGSSSDAVSDIRFAANNSSNAEPAGILQYTEATSEGRQNIKQSLRQTSNESCKVASYNQIDDVSIFAANSTIGGSIRVDQTGKAVGQCQLDNSLSAAAFASGQIDNQAKSGKEKAGKFSMITWVVILIIVLVVAGMMAKMMSSFGGKKTGSPVQPQGSMMGINPYSAQLQSSIMGVNPYSANVQPPIAYPPPADWGLDPSSF